MTALTIKSNLNQQFILSSLNQDSMLYKPIQPEKVEKDGDYVISTFNLVGRERTQNRSVTQRSDIFVNGKQKVWCSTVDLEQEFTDFTEYLFDKYHHLIRESSKKVIFISELLVDGLNELSSPENLGVDQIIIDTIKFTGVINDYWLSIAEEYQTNVQYGPMVRFAYGTGRLYKIKHLKVYFSPNPKVFDYDYIETLVTSGYITDGRGKLKNCVYISSLISDLEKNIEEILELEALEHLTLVGSLYNSSRYGQLNMIKRIKKEKPDLTISCRYNDIKDTEYSSLFDYCDIGTLSTDNNEYDITNILKGEVHIDDFTLGISAALEIKRPVMTKSARSF